MMVALYCKVITEIPHYMRLTELSTMKNSTTCFLALIFLLLLGVLAYAAEPADGIETKVVRVFTTKKTGYYHKPWKSPDFSEVRASGFFFKDDRNFPGRRGLILTNAHAASMAESIKISNGREQRRYEVK